VEEPWVSANGRTQCLKNIQSLLFEAIIIIIISMSTQIAGIRMNPRRHIFGLQQATVQKVSLFLMVLSDISTC
jgi:hypothetical protein